MNMPTVGCVGESIIGNDERGLWFLSHKDDPSQMNWVEGEKCWGSVKVPMGLNVTRTLSVLEKGESDKRIIWQHTDFSEQVTLLFHNMELDEQRSVKKNGCKKR